MLHTAEYTIYPELVLWLAMLLNCYFLWKNAMNGFI